MKSATRIIPASAGAIVVLLLAVVLLTMMGSTADSAINQYTLVSAESATAPTIDGNVDALWASAPALNVPVSGGWAGNVNVTMKSVYNGGNIYVLAQYSDSTLSQRRQPWVKNADGTWTWVPKKSPGYIDWVTPDPTAAYEDKFAVMWNIDDSIAGFNTGSGCAIACHGGTTGDMYTNAPGEMGDMWHFKTVRTGPNGQTDDKYMDDCTTCSHTGRHGDPKTGGGYYNNVDGTGTLPMYTSPTQPAPPYYIYDSAKQAFVDTYSTGDEIAGIITAPFTGDRGQVSTMSSYDASTQTWTVEIGRALVTPDQTNPSIPSPYDVQFSDLDGEYFFDIAVFDNASIEHSMSGGVYKLIFAECDQPALSLSKGAVYWGSMADYTAGILSIDMTVSNTGTADAYGAEITGTTNSNGVVGHDPMPMNIGDIAGGGSAGLTLQYHVPPGVVSYITTVHAAADDGCGNSYSY